MDLMRDGVSLNQAEFDLVDFDYARSDSAKFNNVDSRNIDNTSIDDRPQRNQERSTEGSSLGSRSLNSQTTVIQPSCLTGVEGANFETSFGQALQWASVVLVDLIWIDQVDHDGLSVLLDVMKQADAAGKTVSFLSMDATTRQWLDRQWDQENTSISVERKDVFAPDFEQFLANYQVRKEATLLAVEIASKRQW